MAGRYLVSGAQLGALIALCQTDAKECNQEINKLIEKQFVGNSSENIDSDVIRISKFLNK